MVVGEKVASCGGLTDSNGGLTMWVAAVRQRMAVVDQATTKPAVLRYSKCLQVHVFKHHTGGRWSSMHGVAEIVQQS